jgi:hypothetical protein
VSAAADSDLPGQPSLDLLYALAPAMRMDPAPVRMVMLMLVLMLAILSSLLVVSEAA